MSLIINIAVLLYVVALFFSCFDVSWANSIIGYIFESNKHQLFAAIVLGYFYIWALLKAIEVVTINEEAGNKMSEPDSSVVLSEEEKQKISNSINKARDLAAEVVPLSNVIGLESVKQEIQRLSHFISAQKKRAAVGLPKQKISLHLVFTGNPGTGKTMIAREIAKIYMSYGLLKKGHLVETDRAGLVGEYVGQTAIKTKEKIAEAMGGVLFIDEAYSLLDGSGGFGKEAIDTLLKEMEDNRDEFVVIVAGYGKEMGEFINSNPGLQSRFSTVINFPDYSAEELMQIFELAAKKDGYIVADDARDWLAQWLSSSAPLGAKGFGNGRFVRNLFEKTVVAQSHRLAEINAVEKEVLQLIGISDIKVGASAIE